MWGLHAKNPRARAQACMSPIAAAEKEPRPASGSSGTERTMFNNAKHNYNSVGLAMATILSLLFIFVASGFVFSSASPGTKCAMLIGGAFFLIGAVQPHRMLVLMVPITFYLDEVKRLLIIGGKTGLQDVTSVLAIAPVGAMGIILGCILRRIFFRRRPEPAERIIFVSAIAVFVAFGGMEAFTVGDPLQALRYAANSTVYFLLPWALLQCFRTREEIERFLRFCVLVGVPVALYGIWQYLFGLSDFEISYLQSGLTSTATNLEDIRPRPFSTLGSAHAFSNVMAFMLALSVHFTGPSARGRSRWKANLVVIIYALALVFSLGRGAIFVGMGMIVFAKLFRSKTGVMIAYSFSAVVLGGMILFAQKVQDAMDKLQAFLPSSSDWQMQAFRLGTFSDRLTGYQNVLANPSSWPLFANPLKFRVTDTTQADAEFSHDIFSQMLLRLGAVPVFMGAAVAIYFLWRAHRSVLELPMGKDGIRPLAARLMAIVVVFLLSHAAGSGITVFPMNFWTGIFVGLLCVICLHLQKRNPKAPKGGDASVPAHATTGIA